MVRRREPKDEAYYERIRRVTAHLGLPIAPFVSPRDRERMWRDFRNQDPVVMPWWGWVVTILFLGVLFVGLGLMGAGRHVGAVIMLGWLIAVMLSQAIALVVLVRRGRRRTN